MGFAFPFGHIMFSMRVFLTIPLAAFIFFFHFPSYFPAPMWGIHLYSAWEMNPLLCRHPQTQTYNPLPPEILEQESLYDCFMEPYP